MKFVDETTILVVAVLMAVTVGTVATCGWRRMKPSTR